MLRERRQRKIALPNDGAVLRIQTYHANPARLIPCARKKQPFAPQHRRRVTRAGQLKLPVQIGVRDFCRNGLGVADACAIRPAETRPFLRVALDGCNGKTNEKKCEHRFRDLELHGQSIDVSSSKHQAPSSRDLQAPKPREKARAPGMWSFE